jgi:DNA-directed RNA polymerase
MLKTKTIIYKYINIYTMELTTNNNEQIYVIDFDKVNTIEDIKVVLDGLRILFNSSAPAFEQLQPYLKPLED